VTNPRSSMSSPTNRTPGEVIVQVFGRTDVGRTREHNEDAFVVADLSANNATLQPEVRTHPTGPKGSLFMVADGMGGAAAGEIASAMAVDVVLAQLRSAWVTDEGGGGESFVRAIKGATKAANEQINAYATAHPEYRGMGTTATIAGLLGDTLYLAQVGDSRAYLVRNGVARQITKDQSLMQKLIEAGELTEEEAEHSERRNIILQALGPEATIKVDLTHQVVRRGDTLVLCSDGLSGQVTKDEIASIVSEEADLSAACRRLIDRANENGGPDNITVILARFEGEGLAGPAAEDEVGHRVFPLPETGQTPAASVDRVVESEAPTGQIPATSRPSEPPLPVRDESLITTDEMPVSSARRSAGRVIAIALLIVLVVGAVWFVARQVLAHVATTNSGAPGL
jgi:PPM family protein phosphatase